MCDMRVHARRTFQKNTEKQKFRGHKTDHNLGSRAPFDIKSNALDRISHAWFARNSLSPQTLDKNTLKNKKDDFGRRYDGIPSLHVWLHVLLRWKTPNMQSNMRPIGPSKPGQDAIRTPQHLNIWCLHTYIRAYIRTYIQVQNLCGGSPLAKVDHNVHTYKYKICVRSPLAKVDHTYI